MLNCASAKTPMNANDRLILNNGVVKADDKNFRSIVGGLIYLSHTRPDILFAVNIISRFMHCLSRHRLGAAKRILKYIQ